MNTNTPVRCSGVIKAIEPTLIGQLSKIAATNVQFPEASAAITGLTIASHIAGLAFKTAYLDGSPSGMMLNAIVEQPPSASKTRMQRIFDGYFNREMAIDNERRTKERKRILAGIGKAELSEAQQNVIDSLNPLTVEFSDITIEAAQAATKENNGYLSLRDSEQDLVMTCFGNIYKASGDSKTSGKGLMLKGFDLDNITVKRINAERSFTIRTSVGVMIIAQDGTSIKILNSSGGTGFAERFNFWSEPEVKVDYKIRNRGGRDPELLSGILDHYNERVGDIIDIYKQNKQFNIDNLTSLKMSLAANDMIGDWQNEKAETYRTSNVLFSRFGKSLSMIHRMAVTMWLFDIAVDKSAGQTLLGQLAESNNTVPDHFVEKALLLNIYLLDGNADILLENGCDSNEEAAEAIIKLATETKKNKLTQAAFNKKIKNRSPFKRNPELLKPAFDDLIASRSICIVNNYVNLMAGF